ncbi:MAG: MFS transporter [Mariniblastus sp.]|nr:MFS transporter [Mariniblastus sp.]
MLLAGLLILVSHYVVDTYTALVPPLLGVVETSFQLTPQWTALFLGSGALFSGLAQPLYAWLSDRLNTRIFASLGVLLGGLGVTLIGYAGSPTLLFALYALGMMGVGMYHPVAVSTIGRLAGDRRSWAISWFFVFGMGGWFTGSLVGPGLASGSGSLQNLVYLLLPGIVVGVLLYFSIRNISHKRQVQQHESVSLRDYDWRSISFLYLSSVFRFMVNMGLIYLLLRWTELHVAGQHPDWTTEEIADFSAPKVGWANATMIVGQAIGGLSAGALLKAGHEKWAMVVVPILFAPVVACFSLVTPGALGYAVCCLAGIGFAAMTPVAISLGQRMMPFHTSLGSALMLGAAWAVASMGPRIAEITVQSINLSAGFLVVASFLVLSGLMAIGIKSSSIRSATGPVS